MAAKKQTIGDRCRIARENAGLAATQLAYHAGVSEAAIKKLEYGYSKSPSFSVGLLIAKYCGVTPQWLAFGDAA